MPKVAPMWEEPLERLDIARRVLRDHALLEPAGPEDDARRREQEEQLSRPTAAHACRPHPVDARAASTRAKRLRA